LSVEEWSQTKAELRQAIMEAAEDGRMTCYSEVAHQVEVVHVDPHSTLIDYLLGSILEDEHVAGRPS